MPKGNKSKRQIDAVKRAIEKSKTAALKAAGLRQIANDLDSFGSQIANTELAKKLPRSNRDDALHALAERVNCVADELMGEAIVLYPGSLDDYLAAEDGWMEAAMRRDQIAKPASSKAKRKPKSKILPIAV